jgi:hypothetical protein
MNRPDRPPISMTNFFCEPERPRGGTVDTESAANRDGLRLSFEDELRRLSQAAAETGSVEAVLRLRALGDIAAALETSDLLALAVRVETGNAN